MALELNAKTLMVWFIAFIMVGSTIGFIFLSGYGDLNDNTVAYGEHRFTTAQQGVFTKIDGKTFWFRYLPKETEDIEIDEEAADKIRSTRVVYFTSNFSSKNSQFIASAVYDLDYALQNNMGIVTLTGFINNNLTVNAPHVECNNATGFLPVIFFEDSNITKVELESNCIRLKAKEGDDFLRGKDRLMYSVLGIIGRKT